MERNDMFSLEGKVALVTGASRGIGAACALALGKMGACVFVNYQGSEEKAHAVVAEIEAAGGKAYAVWGDVSEGEACSKMVQYVLQTAGKLDILVNNAGILRDNLLARMSEEEFDAVLDTNLKGVFHMMHHASRHMMRQRSGRIINIASVSGIMGNAGQCNYSAAKAGVIGMTKAAARELASRGITVNAVAPGFIVTDMTGGMSQEVLKLACEQIPMKQMGKPEDVAEAVVFLASSWASYITGQTLCVDGGMTMH